MFRADEVRVRRARVDDLPAMQAMQVRALRTLGATRLDPSEIEAALTVLLAMQIARIAAGTCWLAEAANGRVVAGAAYVPQAEDPVIDLLVAPPVPLPACHGLAARVCGICVEPDRRRRGLGHLMVRVAQAQMVRAGFGIAEVLTTPSTEPLWLSAGFAGIGDHVLTLPSGPPLSVRRMVRLLERHGWAARVTQETCEITFSGRATQPRNIPRLLP